MFIIISKVTINGNHVEHHPCLSGIITTEEVKNMRPQVKLLTEDYLTYQSSMTRLIKGALYVVFVILKGKQFVTFWQFVLPIRQKKENA